MWTNYSDYYTLDPFPDELFNSTVARTVSLIGSKHYYDIMLHYFKHHRIFPASVIRVSRFSDPVSVYYQGVAPYYISTNLLKNQEFFLRHVFSPEEGKFVGFFKTGDTNSFLKKPKLSYCPCCLKEDREKFGMPYFHVVHQYGGIKACPYHGTRLVEFRPDGRFPSLPILKPENYVEPEEANPREILYSQWALKFKDFSHEYLCTLYQSKALDKDISLFKTQYLYEELENFFGYDFLSMVGCAKEQLTHNNEKILYLLHYRNYSIHPFYHLMLWEFLGLTPDDFKDPIYAVHPKNKFFPVPKPENLKSLPVKNVGLGCTTYKTEDSFRELYEFYPIDVKKFSQSLL